VTSHDREFVNLITGKVVETDGGSLTTYSGNYDFYEQQRPLGEAQRQAQFVEWRRSGYQSESVTALS
jgi:ATPase subunit of ABC transporter with duplicated ATPase domains